MIGQRLGSFLLEEKIGAGAMGEVFKATQQLKDGRARTAAVKVVSADFLERDLALKRFQREAEILAQLRHPHIVRYYAHGKFQGIYYYAMEFVEGETLDNVLERRDYLPWREVVELGVQLCHALQYAHDHQVVHRDLKPSNLMINRKGEIKLTDFGIAKDLDATVNLTRTGRTLGTAAYMAPEQIRGTPGISHKTDLYALGCLFYQMLAGRPPFEGKSAVVLMHAHMAEPPPRPSGKNPDVPRALDDLVVQLMAKDPPDRPWDAAQVAHLLQEMLDQDRSGQRPEMAFDRGRDQVVAAGGAVLPTSNGDGRAPSPPRTTASTGGRLRKPPRTRTRAAAQLADEGPDRRRHLVTAALALALAGLVALVLYLAWPPSKETLYAGAAELMESDSRVDWKRAIQYHVEPIERRFPDHDYGADFAEWRGRIALDEARGRSVQLESPTNLGRPRPDRPVEARYKSVLAEIAPHVQLGQHARVADAWGRFSDQYEDDPDARGWALLGEEKRQEQIELLREQKRAASILHRQAVAAEQNGLVDSASIPYRRLISDYATAAEGDPEFLRMISDAQAALDRLEGKGPSAAPPPETTPPVPSPATTGDDAPLPPSPDPAADEPLGADPAPGSP